MAIENVALVNDLGQVVNHVVVDIDDTETIAALHEVWGTTRFVVTTTQDVIMLDESPEIWTTHCDDPDCENTGFNLPVFSPEPEITLTFSKIKIGERIYPSDSLLFKENASKRPAGWVLPEDEEEVSLADGVEID